LIIAGLTAAGILVGIGVIVYAEYAQRHWVPSARVVGVVAFSVFVFGFLVTEYSRSWRSPSFWLWISVLLTFHLIGYSLLFRVVEQWPTIWFALITTVEVPMLSALLFSRGYPHAPSPLANAGFRHHPVALCSIEKAPLL
jgi:hypothetical protein